MHDAIGVLGVLNGADADSLERRPMCGAVDVATDAGSSILEGAAGTVVLLDGIGGVGVGSAGLLHDLLVVGKSAAHIKGLLTILLGQAGLSDRLLRFPRVINRAVGFRLLRSLLSDGLRSER